MNYASIDSVLLSRPYLKLIEHDTHSIAKRIKEIETGYFIVFNRRSGNHEVHSTENKGWDTYCFTIPYEKLDARTLAMCRRTSVATRGDKLRKEIQESNSRIEAEQQRDFRRHLYDGSLDTAERVASAIDEDELHEGYHKTHYMGASNTSSGGDPS